MADLTAIRQALAANLSTLTGTQFLPYMLSDPTPPTAWVVPGEVSYDLAYGRGIDQHVLLVQVFVSEGAGDQASQSTLDSYLAGSGPGSIKEAIENDKTLGGVCADLRVTGVSGYRYFSLGDDRRRYLGAEWRVEVLAAG